ncbi:hypothetical protein KPL70_010798 [Citrus sinensis]|nr:hypothetical protein KPL70_010798 [Citrus sinensis]
MDGPIEPYKVANFGIVTDEDSEADREAFEKLTSMIDGGLKTNYPLSPLPKTKLCTDQETTKYLKHYIEKKTENTKKLKETQDVGSAEMNEPVKPPEAAKFGIVTDEDKEADLEAFEKLTSMTEERLKTNYCHPQSPVFTSCTLSDQRQMNDLCEHKILNEVRLSIEDRLSRTENLDIRREVREAGSGIPVSSGPNDTTSERFP